MGPIALGSDSSAPVEFARHTKTAVWRRRLPRRTEPRDRPTGDVTRDEGGRGRDATAAARLNSANRAVAAAEATGTSVLLDVWAAATGPFAAGCGSAVHVWVGGDAEDRRGTFRDAF